LDLTVSKPALSRFVAPLPPVAILDRLCQLLVTEKGYSVLGLGEGAEMRLHGVALEAFEWRVARIPELAPLAATFERVLVRSDGMSFEVVAIKDRLQAGSSPIAASLEELKAIGQSCLRYTGTVQRTKMPVTIRVWELSAGTAPETVHLRPLRCNALRTKVDVSAWSLHPATGTVWSNALFNGLLAGRKQLEALLAQASSGPAPRVGARVAVGAGIRYPLLTWALVAAMAAAYVLQLTLGEFSGLLAPTLPSLVAFGALVRPLVLDQGQLYRVVSAAFLHGGLIHLVSNGAALLLGGMVLESLLGRAWLLVIFVLSVLGGSGASLLFNDAGTVSVGASGGIMGMLAAAVLVTSRLPYGRERTSAQMQLVYWLVPALIPLATHRTGGKVDFAAHLGGAIVGAAVGLALLRAWRQGERLPRFRMLATGLALCLAALVTVCLGQAYAGRAIIQAEQALRAQLGPEELFRRLAEAAPGEVEASLRDVQRRFPRDPRTAYLSALVALERRLPTEAEDWLKRGLSEQAILSSFFPDGRLEASTRTLLARLLLQRERLAEAEAYYHPLCATNGGSAPKGLDEGWVRAVCSR
jgi:rhomboid protease GluP